MRFVVLSLSFFACLFVSTSHGGEGLSFPDSFSLETHVGSETGAALSGPLGVNEELLVVSRIPQLGGAGHPVLANIIWQVYTSSGIPLPNLNKTRQIISLGNQEFCLFRVRAGELENGTYFIGLTHQLASDPTIFYQASIPFEIDQPLAITQVVVAESPRGKRHQRIFYEDQSPHVFVYYYLAEDVFTALVQIDVLDDEGAVRASRTVSKDNDFSKKRERVGIKLVPGLFVAGEKATVLVSVSTPDNITVTAESSFEILAVELGIHLPDQMMQGTVADFQLFTPPTFSSPYNIDFGHEDGFIFRSEKDVLGGKLFVTSVAGVGRHHIEVVVTDSLGNRASCIAVIDVVQGAGRNYQRMRKKRNRASGKQGGSIGSSTRR